MRAWFAISLQTFGGPAGQIAVMQRELVEERRWIGPQRFLHALNYCMLLPGPEAQQLAVYIGWLLNGLRGGLVAGILFVLPGMVALLALSAIYVAWGDATAVTAIFAGLAPAVVAVVTQAVLRVGGRALGTPALVALAAAAFMALALFEVPFPLVVAAAAGSAGCSAAWPPHPDQQRQGQPRFRWAAAADPDEACMPSGPARPAPSASWGWGCWPGLCPWLRSPRAPAPAAPSLPKGCSSLGPPWSPSAAPTPCSPTSPNAPSRPTGGYQPATWSVAWPWPRPPGPLIMVVQFVAFLGAYHPDLFTPWAAAVVGALLTTWVTFVPCFLFIFLGAPYVERLRGNHSLSAALTGITAAVVGVIANLALYFAVHTLFATTQPRRWGLIQMELPEFWSLRSVPLVISAAALVMIFRLRWSVPRTLVVCAGLGLAAALAGLPLS